MHAEALHEVDSPGETPRTGHAAWIHLRGLALLLACGTLIGLAARMSPGEEFYGTHRQLGLPSCSFLVRTGYPCPSCGLTTSVSAMAHGRVAQSLSAQPFGTVLLPAMAAFALAGAAEAVSGRNVLAAMRFRWWWVLAALAGMMAGWGIVLAGGLLSGRLPIR